MSEITSMIPNREFKLSELSKINSSASEIDGNIIPSYFKLNINKKNIISVVGDSITEGTGSSGYYYNGYASLVRKMLAKDFGTKNEGHSPLYGDNLFHIVSRTGNWSGTFISSGFTDIIATSSTANDNITVALPSTQTSFEIGYIQTELSFTFDVYVNNILSTTITTSSGSDEQVFTSKITLSENGATNQSIIKIVVVSGTCKLNSIRYYADDAKTSINVYGRAGRKIIQTTTGMIDKIFAESSFVIWALNHNDLGLSGTDLTNSLALLDYVSAKSISSSVPLMILDFGWTYAVSNPIRAKLKIMGEQENSYLISFPEMIKDDGSIPSSSYLTATINSWADISHPNDKGHQWIASIIGKKLMLSSYSKNDANQDYDVTLSLLNTELALKIDNNSIYDAVINTIKIGKGAGSISSNILIGKGIALTANTTGYSNTVIGNDAAAVNTTGNRNIAIGDSALKANATGYKNVAVGGSSFGFAPYADNVTGLGYLAGAYYVNGSLLNGSITNVTCLGSESRVSGNNQVQLGNTATTTYAYGAVQDRSDIRDKADIEITPLGLDFICKVNPVQYRWDYRDDYISIDEETGEATTLEKDGSKKRSRLHQGVIAQQVKEVIDELGVDFGGYQDHSLSGGCDVKSIGYQEFIPPLIKAIKELRAEIEILKSKA